MLLPFLTMAAKLTPSGMEATFFSGFMSVHNFGQQVAGLSGSYLTEYLRISKDDFSNLWIAVGIRAALMVVPVMIVHQLVPHTIRTDCEAKQIKLKPT